LLSAKPNLSIFNSEGCSAIHISTSKGHKAFVENLLEKGVHVDEKDKND
jgi:Ankyrin repeat.